MSLEISDPVFDARKLPPDVQPVVLAGCSALEIQRLTRVVLTAAGAHSAQLNAVDNQGMCTRLLRHASFDVTEAL
jgi:hypothetical protein